MSKRKGNDMGKIGRITKRSDVVKVEQYEGKDKPEKDDAEKREVKTTMYLTVDHYNALKQLEFEVKAHFGDRSRYYSRPAILAEAIQILLDDYAENGVDCEVIARMRARKV